MNGRFAAFRKECPSLGILQTSATPLPSRNEPRQSRLDHIPLGGILADPSRSAGIVPVLEFRHRQPVCGEASSYIGLERLQFAQGIVIVGQPKLGLDVVDLPRSDSERDDGASRAEKSGFSLAGS